MRARVETYDVQIKEFPKPKIGANDNPAALETLVISGGIMEAAFNVYNADDNLGIKMGCAIPTSAGRVAGIVGLPDGLVDLQGIHGTFEEQTVRNWLSMEPLILGKMTAAQLYQGLLQDRWEC